MQKKLLIPILAVLVLIVILVVRGCGNKDTSQDDKQNEPQTTQTDALDNANTTENDVSAELDTQSSTKKKSR